MGGEAGAEGGDLRCLEGGRGDTDLRMGERELSLLLSQCVFSLCPQGS